MSSTLAPVSHAAPSGDGGLLVDVFETPSVVTSDVAAGVTPGSEEMLKKWVIPEKYLFYAKDQYKTFPAEVFSKYIVKECLKKIMNMNIFNIDKIIYYNYNWITDWITDWIIEWITGWI